MRAEKKSEGNRATDKDDNSMAEAGGRGERGRRMEREVMRRGGWGEGGGGGVTGGWGEREVRPWQHNAKTQAHSKN